MLTVPRFTIITVCFNAEATLPATAGSLVAQRCTDYEWLVVDGASTDRTVAIARDANVADMRLISEPDGGIFDAMNKGVELARGDWLYFLNCGDAIADADVLTDVAAAIDADPEIALLWGDMLYVSDVREWARIYRHVKPSTIVFDDLNHQAVFARRTLFDDFGQFNLDFKTSADYDWLVRVLHGGAKYRRLQRIIARFATGGMHSADPQALAAERHRLRLQYLSQANLSRGLFIGRIRRRLRILAGHGG